MNRDSGNSNLHCLHPWYSLDISYSGHAKVGCCPYKGRPLCLHDPGAPDILDVWTDEWFQQLRKGFTQEGGVPPGCQGCRNYLPIKKFTPPEGLNELQNTNLETCLQAAREQHATPDCSPSRYSFCFTSRCNLKCIMCSQHDSRDSGSKELSAGILLNQKNLLSRASSIFVSGGEPLLSQECLKFIQALCMDPELLNVGLEIVTNGLLLDRALPFLENKQRLSLHVSLDGIGDTYEKVRRGGQWKVVARQIESALALSKMPGRDWKISTSCILMRSTIMGLVDYLQWCLDRDVGIVLQPLMATRETVHEDLVAQPELLKDIPSWEQKLEKALELLVAAGKPGLAGQVQTYRDSLLAALKRGASGPVVANYKCFVQGDSCKGKRVVLWGVGSNYRDCWADWLANHKHEIDFLGFVDNDPSRWNTILDGYTVRSPEEMRKLPTPEFIIVASQIVWREEIIRQCCEEMGWRHSQFV